MSENKYKVIDETGNVLIDSATLRNALLFVKAYFEEYYKDTATELKICMDDKTKKSWEQLDE